MLLAYSYKSDFKIWNTVYRFSGNKEGILVYEDVWAMTIIPLDSLKEAARLTNTEDICYLILLYEALNAHTFSPQLQPSVGKCTKHKECKRVVEKKVKFYT